MSTIGLLAIFGTIGGLVYAALGLMAVKHLNEKKTELDQVVGWSLWWCIEWRRYDNEGKRLCVIGAFILSIAITCWASVVILRKP